MPHEFRSAILRAALPKLMLGAAATLALCMSVPGSALAQTDTIQAASPQSSTDADTVHDIGLLVGSWVVTVTQYNCKTGVTRPPFQSLLGFLPGGVEIETTSNPALQPGQRTTGFGNWTYTGNHSFALKTEAFILFPTMAGMPIPRGKQFISQAIRLTGPASFSSLASIAFTTPSEEVVLTGCARAEAHRL